MAALPAANPFYPLPFGFGLIGEGMKKREPCTYRTTIGGQALIEGILMRGPKKQAVAVRRPDGLIVKEEELKLVGDRYPILKLPFIRGTVNFIDSMVRGVKALMFSAEQAGDESYQPDKFDLWIEKKFGAEKAQKAIVTIAVILGIAFSVGLFILLPTLLAGLITPLIGSGFVKSLVEGIIRIAIFLLYIYLMTKVGDIRRVFEYHGAEHKSIFCYEKNLPLTVENVRVQPRNHPRCGTSFLFIVMIVSILVFSVFRWSNPFVRMGLRILVLPVIVGISYEISRWTGRHDNWISAILSAPGKALQHLTVFEPDDSMIEVAIAALTAVIPEEKGLDAW
jgi:uncharacterized protein YqhQ